MTVIVRGRAVRRAHPAGPDEHVLRSALRSWPAAAIGLGAVIGIAINASVPTLWLAALVPLAALTAAAQLRSHRVLPLVAFALALVPYPTAVPSSIDLGGRAVFFTDLALPLAATFALRRPSTAPRTDRVMSIYALFIVGACLVGMMREAQLSALIQDARGPLYLVCGYFIVTRTLRWEDRRVVLRVISAILWFSAGMIVLSLVTGSTLLTGRIDQVSAFLGGDSKESLDAVRFLIASKELALVTIIVSLGMFLLAPQGEVRRVRTTVALVLPAFVVVFSAYSRQSIIGLAAAFLFLMVASPRRVATVHRLVVGGAGLAVALALVMGSGIGGQITDPEQGLIGKQVQGFSDRVLSGLMGENLRNDPGNEFRVLEIELATEFAREHPLAGGGIGTPYRSGQGIVAFDDVEYGRRYVHNVYLWYAVHGGIIGVAVIVVVMLRPLTTTVRRAFVASMPHRNVVLAIGAAHLAFVVVAFVEPIIHLIATAPLAGGMIAVLAVAGESAPSTSTSADAGPTVDAALPQS